MSSYPEHRTAFEIERDEALSPAGLHAAESPEAETTEPEPDFSEQALDQHGDPEKIRAIQALARNKGRIKQTATELGIPYQKLITWRDESLSRRRAVIPMEMDKSSSVKDARHHLGVTVNSILKNLPKRLATASLQEQITIVKAFVPLMTEIDDLTAAKKAALTPAKLREMAKKKLKDKRAEESSE